MKFAITVIALASSAVLSAQTTASRPAAVAGLDTAAIDKAIGRPGQVMPGDVYRVGFPRTDLKVTVGTVSVLPGLALGSWAAFKAAGSGAVVHGDLVLLDTEMNPVITSLQQSDFEITAVHNHLLNESPSIMYLHYWGQGNPVALAQAVREALGHSATPIAPPTAPASPPPAVPVDAIEQAIGMHGTNANGVLSFAQPRPEPIQMMGVTLPPSMGMATAINFQATSDGKVAATGDFVMIADEVNKVARALRSSDIAITALHNHMLHGTPELYFMHFWAEGDPAAIASGLKTALALLKK
jgi:uncharacterized protein DUF1259